MKVCIVTTSFPRWPEDDRGTFVIGAARALRARGVRVRVVAIHNPGTKTREHLDGIEVIRPRYLWPERLEILQRESGGMPIMLRKNRLAWLAVAPLFLAHSIATAQHATGCDLIHANWTMSAAAAWATSFLHRRPLIVTVQGSDIFESERLPVLKQLNRLVLTRCSHIFALSHALANATISLGIPEERVEVMPNGVDTNRFHPLQQARERLILSAGSLIERKGMKYLIQAMQKVFQSFPDYRLVIIGEGPQYQDLLHLASLFGIADRVTLAGYQTHIQVSEWMRRASVFILPSVEEGLGVVLLEALASGTPCVATRVGGIPDVVTPEVGILVPPGDADAIAQATSVLLGDLARLEMMRQNARWRALEQYSWDIIASRLIQVYEATLTRSSSQTTFKRDLERRD